MSKSYNDFLRLNHGRMIDNYDRVYYMIEWEKIFRGRNTLMLLDVQNIEHSTSTGVIR